MEFYFWLYLNCMNGGSEYREFSWSWFNVEVKYTVGDEFERLQHALVAQQLGMLWFILVKLDACEE